MTEVFPAGRNTGAPTRPANQPRPAPGAPPPPRPPRAPRSVDARTPGDRPASPPRTPPAPSRRASTLVARGPRLRSRGGARAGGGRGPPGGRGGSANSGGLPGPPTTPGRAPWPPPPPPRPKSFTVVNDLRIAQQPRPAAGTSGPRRPKPPARPGPSTPESVGRAPARSSPSPRCTRPACARGGPPLTHARRTPARSEVPMGDVLSSGPRRGLTGARFQQPSTPTGPRRSRPSSQP